MINLGLVILLSVLVAGCASTSVPWQNPDLPSSQWSKDWRGCKRWAEQQVGFNDDDSKGPFRDYDRSMAKRQIDAYAGQCMRDLGYIPKAK